MFLLGLFEALQAERVRYVLVGGLAINFHGINRNTMDVDLTLAMDQRNLKRFLKVAQKLKLSPSLPVSINALCDAAQLDTWVKEKRMLAFSLREPTGMLPTVDILVQPKVPFEKMHRDRKEKVVGKIKVSYASVEDLIALKTKTGRRKDASDIRALKKLPLA